MENSPGLFDERLISIMGLDRVTSDRNNALPIE